MLNIFSIIIASIFITFTIPNAHASISKTDKINKIDRIDNITSTLLREFQTQYKNKEDIKKLQSKVIDLSGKAVPALVEVMKKDLYPDPNRWLATFLLGQIMGKKASPFISKFLYHPHWVLRMAGLKTLLALKDDRYAKDYAQRLDDNSLLVRTQALENIRTLNLKNHADAVWAMLYHKHNYQVADGKLKRIPIIKNVIKTLGDLDHQKIKPHLLSMASKEKYRDIFDEIDYSLQKITGKNSPDGDYNVKKIYWERLALTEKKL
ncbi:MAG: HEAT repeat domain-containing protein [Oligoflexia bacterium]|nr:HEAT repeat domain-containing protein [Oligoflexia bacterium]